MNRPTRSATLASAVVWMLVAATVACVRTGSDADHDTLHVSGNIEVTDAEVAFRVPGFVAERLLSEGESVRAGDLVARLDDREVALEVSLRRAEVEAARAALAELEAGFRSEEIEQAEAALELARAEARRVELDFQRQKELFEKEVISAREYEGSRAAAEVVRARVREASARLQLLRNGPRPEDIEQSRARLDQASENLALAKTRRDWTELRSPLTGIVLAEHVEPGEYVAAGAPIVTVGEMERVWLRAYVDERDLGRVKVGQRVELRTDTFPDRRYEGRLSFIAPEAEFTPKNVQTEKERVKLVYRIKIDIPNPSLELKPGMPADADILLEEPRS